MNKLLLSAAVAAVAVAAPASAATYLFTLTGNVNATFTLDSSPTPSLVSDGKGFFQIQNVAGVYSNGSTTANVNFFLTNAVAQNGGLELDVPGGNAFLVQPGAQLFTGTLAMPTFKTGTFEFRASPGETLSISAAAVPEPASWAMMVGGFGLLGATMRRRARTTVSFG